MIRNIETEFVMQINVTNNLKSEIGKFDFFFISYTKLTRGSICFPKFADCMSFLSIFNTIKYLLIPFEL